MEKALAGPVITCTRLVPPVCTTIACYPGPWRILSPFYSVTFAPLVRPCTYALPLPASRFPVGISFLSHGWIMDQFGERVRDF